MDNEKLKNLDWMYAKPELQLDDYMLGKKIDKQLIRHVFGEEGDEDDRAAKSEGAAFQQGGLNPTYDQLCKLREDPLIAIKRAEQNKAREVVDNPVLMKKFKTYLMQMVEEDKSSGGKKKKKKSKKKKENSPDGQYDISINSGSDSRKHQMSSKRKREARSNSSDSRSRSPIERKRLHETSSGNRNRSRSLSSSNYTTKRTAQSSSNRHKSNKRHRSRSVSKSKSPHRKAEKGLHTKRFNKESKRHHRSRSRSKSRPRSPAREAPSSSSSSKSSKNKESDSRHYTDERNQSVSIGSLNPFRRNEAIRPSGSGFSKGAYIPPKLSKEELEKKRKQMMKDAEEHEQVRVKQLKRHEVSLEEEEKEFKQMKYTEDPTRFMKSGISSRGTDVGDRIRAKLNNVQRTKAQEDKFLSR